MCRLPSKRVIFAPVLPPTPPSKPSAPLVKTSSSALPVKTNNKEIRNGLTQKFENSSRSAHSSRTELHQRYMAEAARERPPSEPSDTQPNGERVLTHRRTNQGAEPLGKPSDAPLTTNPAQIEEGAEIGAKARSQSEPKEPQGGKRKLKDRSKAAVQTTSEGKKPVQGTSSRRSARFSALLPTMAGRASKKADEKDFAPLSSEKRLEAERHRKDIFDVAARAATSRVLEDFSTWDLLEFHSFPEKTSPGRFRLPSIEASLPDVMKRTIPGGANAAWRSYQPELPLSDVGRFRQEILDHARDWNNSGPAESDAFNAHARTYLEKTDHLIGNLNEIALELTSDRFLRSAPDGSRSELLKLATDYKSLLTAMTNEDGPFQESRQLAFRLAQQHVYLGSGLSDQKQEAIPSVDSVAGTGSVAPQKSGSSIHSQTAEVPENRRLHEPSRGPQVPDKPRVFNPLTDEDTQSNYITSMVASRRGRAPQIK